MLTAADFDYELPPELVAERPAERRDAARLLVMTDENQARTAAPFGVLHRRMSDLPKLLGEHVGPRTLLVLNDTKVLPARLRGHKLHDGAAGEDRGGRIELLLLAPAVGGDAGGQRWRSMYRTSKPLRSGQRLRLSQPNGTETCDATVVECGGGEATIDFGPIAADAFLALLGRIGEIPLPPYIERARERSGQLPDRDADRERYQTVFARVAGSVAAPTAGLHFTPELLAALQAAGHEHATITLHVGPGTFMPLRSDSITDHVMHAERYHISDETAAAIATARRDGRPVVAVGTTVVRTLESATAEGAAGPRPGWGETRLFIYPPYRFRAVDAMLTNFHLPRSTLLMLVSALAGRERVLAAYADAIRAGYRFYSFGDAMLIPRRFAAAAEEIAP